MLDLNVEIVSASFCNDDRSMMVIEAEEEEPKILEVYDDEEEDRELSAGTSDSSSVVNADDPLPGAGDENSSSPLIFGILKKEEPCGGGRPEIVTRQLFPAAGGGSELGFDLPPSPDSRPQWLNLSYGGGKAAAELRVLQQKQQQQQEQQQVRKSRRGPRSRSSQYRGVTFYRRTGRWESHIWDCGKQVYLGGFDTAYAAARAYDRAAVKFRGVDADINFILGDYEEDMKQMGNLTKEEFVHILRRQSNGASRASSKFRGVTLHKCGKWEARMGQFLGKKAAIQFNGTDAGINNHLEPRPYDRDIILDVGSQGRGGGHHQLGLDLNLGISPPSSGGGDGGGSLLKAETTSSGHVRLCYSSTATDIPAMPRHDLPLGYGSFSAPDDPPIWSPMYPFLLPNPEVLAIDMILLLLQFSKHGLLYPGQFGEMNSLTSKWGTTQVQHEFIILWVQVMTTASVGLGWSSVASRSSLLRYILSMWLLKQQIVFGQGKAAAEKKRAAAEGSSKSGWKTQGGNGGGGSSVPPPLAKAPLSMFNNAASSGFSSSLLSSSTMPMTPHHLLHHRNLASQNPNSSPLIKPANPANSFPSLFRN